MPSQISFSKIRTLSSRINSVEDLSTLLNLIMNSAKELIDCEGVSLLLLDDNTKTLKFNIALGRNISQIKKLAFPLGYGIAGQVAQTGIPILSNQAQTDDRLFDKIDELNQFTTETLICVPMKVRDKIIGVLEAINAKDGTFQSKDQEILAFLANEAAIAIHNRLLFSRLNRANDELNNRIKELKYLYELSLLSQSHQNIYKVLDSILQGVSKVLQVNKSSILLYNEQENVFKMISSVGHDESILHSLEVPPQDGIDGMILKNKVPLLVADVNKEAHLLPHRKGIYDSNSFLAVPIIVEGACIGVVNMTDKIGNHIFTSSDLQVLTSVASFIAKYYRNFKLKEEIAEQSRIKKEMEIASTLQNSFLPKKLPALKGLDIAVYNGTHSKIGGDFYDFIKIDENKIAIAISQVSGKGVPAALSIAFFKNMLRGQVQQNASPKLVLNWVNQQLCMDTTAEMSIKVLYTLIDTHNRVLTYSAGGYGVYFVLFKQSTREVEILRRQDQSLGENPDIQYLEFMSRYEKGDILLSWTEERNNISFLNENLRNFIWSSFDDTSNRILQKLKETYSRNLSQNGLDQLTTLIILKTEK